MPGEKVLVTGESGTGKSTLVRALVGLWPWGEGDIEMPAGTKSVLVAAAAICADRHTPTGCQLSRTRPIAGAWKRLRKSLKKVGLGHLVERLEEEGHRGTKPYRAGRNSAWRLRECSFIGPTIIVLDEATAALDSREPGSIDGAFVPGARRSHRRQLGHRPNSKPFMTARSFSSVGTGVQSLSATYLISKPDGLLDRLLQWRAAPTSEWR